VYCDERSCIKQPVALHLLKNCQLFQLAGMLLIGRKICEFAGGAVFIL